MNKRRRYKAKRRRREWVYRTGRASKRQWFGRVCRLVCDADRPRLIFNPRALEVVFREFPDRPIRWAW